MLLRFMDPTLEEVTTISLFELMAKRSYRCAEYANVTAVSKICKQIVVGNIFDWKSWGQGMRGRNGGANTA
jgi:hypothetical protein